MAVYFPVSLNCESSTEAMGVEDKRWCHTIGIVIANASCTWLSLPTRVRLPTPLFSS